MFTFNQVSKRRLSMGASLALILGLAASIAAPAAFAASQSYRMVLRYYDDVQVTYSLTYPAAPTPGPQVRAEDVPIGGVGIPKPSGTIYEISPYVFTQVYCVDPFTAFHGLVPGLGGSSHFVSPHTEDTISGYVSGAPWVSSGAMQAYGDAVAWIAANGYRGIYNHGLPDDDDESQASVDRLRDMFPTITPIDREIAVMATKVAIWKVVAGDNVQVKATSLDGRTGGERAAFDALVTALVDASKNPGGHTGELVTTKFDLTISNDPAAEYDLSTSTTYNFYGPMNATATLTDPGSGGNLNSLDRVFLSATGLNSSGVRFVQEPDASPTMLSSANLPGTTKSTQYITGTPSGTTWESGDFYLAIPKTRVPDRGDELLIKAMAQAPAVKVKDGTAVALIFAKNDVQDWNAIQAFIGAASGEQELDLYAETSWYTGETSLGDLQISKIVDNVSINDQYQPFTFAVYYSTDPAGVSPARTPLNLTHFPVRGAASVNTSSTPHTFTLRNGGVAVIEGLPMYIEDGPADQDTYYYWVEERTSSLPNGEYGTPTFVVKGDSGVAVSNNRVGPFTLDEVESLGVVTVTNTRLVGNMMINKVLAGNYEGADVDEDTVFTVIIRETVTVAGKTLTNYLKFEETAPGVYKCIGNNGVNDPATADEIEITANQPVTITNLWTNVPYRVIEVGGDGTFKIGYTGNNVTIVYDQMSEVTVTNTYGEGPRVDTGGAVVTPNGWGLLLGMSLIAALSLGGWQLVTRRGE